MSKSPPNQHIPIDLSLPDDLLLRAVRQFGTPLYVYDKQMLRHNWELLSANLPRAIKVHYSVKANPNLAVIRAFAELGARFEVASEGELLAVLQVGVPPSHIVFVGPGKTARELSFAIMQGVFAVVVESPREMSAIQELTLALGRPVRVALRVNPGVGRGMLAMGGATQFGMELDTALDLLQHGTAFTNIEFVGVHGYLGTQILDWQVILEHCQLILQLSEKLQQARGMNFEFIDMGGGFGIPYYETESTLDLPALRTALLDLIDQYCRKYPATSMIAVESGRFLVGSAGVFVARVIDVKTCRGQCFVVLDGGINVFGGYDRYAGARPTPIRVAGADDRSSETLTLCGPLCTPLDRLAANVVLPMPRIGDLIIFYLAGAYGCTASPGLFLSHGFPAEVMVMGEDLALIRRRMPPDDFFLDQCFAS